LATWKEITSATTPRWLNYEKDQSHCISLFLSQRRTNRRFQSQRIADNIAGICSEGRNVLGMMPHPERAKRPELGCVRMAYKIFMLKS